jgi:hypothetical protein
VKRVPITLEQAAAALRTAAIQLAEGLNAPVSDARDSAFQKLDSRLQRAALTYAKVVNDDPA